MTRLPGRRRELRQFRCLFCGAEPGKPCRSRSGRICLEHGDRYYQWWDEQGIRR